MGGGSQMLTCNTIRARLRESATRLITRSVFANRMQTDVIARCCSIINRYFTAAIRLRYTLFLTLKIVQDLLASLCVK